jgi:hypothetical protein
MVTTRRIKDDDGNPIVPDKAPGKAPGKAPAPKGTPPKGTPPQTLPNGWAQGYLDTLTKPVTWVDEQILVQDIKAGMWNQVKICSECHVNLVPVQYDTCNSCNNAKFEGKAYHADSLGRRFPL